MPWLQSHVYIATWLGLTVGVISFLAKNINTRFANVDWQRSIIYFAFLVGLGFSFAPQISREDKKFAHAMTAFLMGAMLFGRK